MKRIWFATNIKPNSHVDIKNLQLSASMRMSVRVILVILSFFVQSQLMAQTAFSQANALYNKGNYVEAIKSYESILLNEGVAPELYYNLGNAYYKSNQLGKSILNYERALKLNSGYDYAAVNLEMARMKVVDNIVQPPSFFVGRWIGDLMNLFNSNEWLYTAFVFFILSLSLMLLFIFNRLMAVRKSAFFCAVALFVLAGITLIFSGVKKYQYLHHVEAIVMTGTLPVKSSPDESGTDLYQLHEGTKVEVRSTLGDWTEIKLGNGAVGWVQTQRIENI